jgi:hypothetical protein
VSTISCPLRVASVCSKRFMSNFNSRAYCSKYRFWIFGWFLKSLSWYSQNLPCSPAAIAATEASAASL